MVTRNGAFGKEWWLIVGAGVGTGRVEVPPMTTAVRSGSRDTCVPPMMVVWPLARVEVEPPIVIVWPGLRVWVPIIIPGGERLAGFGL